MGEGRGEAEGARGGRPIEKEPLDARRVTIEHAAAEYIQNAKDEGCGEDTLGKKIRTFQWLTWEKKSAEGRDVIHKSPSLVGWATERGFKYIDQLGTPELRAWRSSGHGTPGQIEATADGVRVLLLLLAAGLDPAEPNARCRQDQSEGQAN